MPVKKQQNLINLYRESLKLLTLEDVELPTLAKDSDEYKKFCRYCHQVYYHPFYALIQKQLLLAQMSKSYAEATEYDHLQAGRAIIPALALYDDLFKKYALEYQGKYMSKEEDFDPSKGFESVNN